MSRLRAVPAPTKPLVIDPPCPDTLSDEWRDGWQACREVLGQEIQDAYRRGMRATPARPLITIGHAVSVTGAFVIGFVLAVAFFA